MRPMPAEESAGREGDEVLDLGHGVEQQESNGEIGRKSAQQRRPPPALGSFTCLPRPPLGSFTCLPRPPLGSFTRLPRPPLGRSTCLPWPPPGTFTCLPRPPPGRFC